jgi:hypothetical protein
LAMWAAKTRVVAGEHATRRIVSRYFLSSKRQA